MINSRFGIFLSSIRREKGISARQLASDLHVSEKTLELWESGRRYPELTVLPRIAEILGVTPVELINGERNPKDYVATPEEEALVRDMIAYAERVSTLKTSGMTFAAVSVLLLVGVLTCFLVNFLIERGLSWSLFPFGGALLVWLTAAPLFLAKRLRVQLSVAGLTLSSIAYLFLIEHLSPAKGWVLPLALPLFGVLFVSALAVAWFFRRGKGYRSRAAAVSLFMFGLPVNLASHALVEYYMGYRLLTTSAVVVGVLFLFAGFITLIAGEIRRRRIRQGQK